MAVIREIPAYTFCTRQSQSVIVEEIPGWFSDQEGEGYLEELLRHPRGVLVEVGSCLGRSLAFVVEAFTDVGGTVYAVDIWDWSLDAFKEFEWYMWRNGLLDRIDTFRESSLSAATRFSPHSIDVIFLDADHTYESVAEDIRAWVPKLKTTGFLMGHDYDQPGWPGVKEAVNELLGEPDRLHGTVWVCEHPYERYVARSSHV